MGMLSSVLSFSMVVLCLLTPGTYAWVLKYDYVMTGTVLDVFYSGKPGDFDITTPYIDKSVSCYIAMIDEDPTKKEVIKFNGEFHECIHYEVCEYAESLMRRSKRVNFYGLFSVEPSNTNANNYVVGLEAAGKNVRWSQ